MRAIEKVTTDAGRTHYKIRFRHRGRETSRTFTTKRDANTFRIVLDEDGPTAAIEHFAERERRSGIPTLDDWTPVALASRSGIAPGQRITYQQVYERYWSKPLGRLQLAEITKADVSRAVIELSERGGRKGTGLADKTVANAHGILSSLMADAVDAGHIKASPCKGIRMPRRTSHESAEMRFLSRDEFARLYDATPEHWRPMVAFMVGTGARWGEASALLADDVDLEAGVVRIRRSVKWTGYGSADSRVVGPPKTKRSLRTIALPPELVPILAPLKSGNRGEMFRRPDGTATVHKAFYDGVWLRTVAAAGLAGTRIHDLRHTHASWLIAANMPLPVIQRRLGHESITTTVDRYGHLYPDQDASAARAVGAMLSSGLEGGDVLALDAGREISGDPE